MKITNSHMLDQLFGGKLTTAFAAKCVLAAEENGEIVDEYEGVDLATVRAYIELYDGYLYLLKAGGNYAANESLWGAIHALHGEIQSIGDQPL